MKAPENASSAAAIACCHLSPSSVSPSHPASLSPQLLCFCDRYWGPVEACRIPGATSTRLPFVCPMDHILEPFNFDDKPGDLGPALAFREYSFLSNERTPAAVLVRLTSQRAARGAAGCCGALRGAARRKYCLDGWPGRQRAGAPALCRLSSIPVAAGHAWAEGGMHLPIP